MAFLDNSGDIILDAVLTDTGRMRLAKGDGSFRIVKFALADDEIDYSLYDRLNTNGSAYFDLEILQMPVFEAFSNNASSMKNKLVSVARNNILYLPVVKLQDQIDGYRTISAKALVDSGFVLAVDSTTEDFFFNNLASTQGMSFKGSTLLSNGFLKGTRPSSGGAIATHQGVDNVAYDPTNGLENDLKENAYIIEMDNRLMRMISFNGSEIPPSYIDDDNIASYYVTSGETQFISQITNTSTNDSTMVIAGARGTELKFRLKSSTETKNSNYLFDQLGASYASTDFKNSSGGALSTTYNSLKYIISNINVTGVTTGFGIDIPVTLVKKIS